MIQVFIPSFRNIIKDAGKSYTVFDMEVIISGQCHKLEKRYSSFHSLHKKLKKIMKTPAFPPKKVRNWDQRVLEHRRQCLETYMQGIMAGTDIPQTVLIFLGLTCISSSTSYDSTLADSEEFSPSHHPILAFEEDPFLSSCYNIDNLPDIVIDGVLQGFYY